MPLYHDADPVSSLDRSHLPGSLDHLYDWLNGVALVNMPLPAVATGSITFAAIPSVGDTINLDGTTVTFIANGATPSGNQVALGVDLPSTMAALLAFVSASADANISKMTYAAPSTALLITAKALGAAGNAYTLAASVATVSGAMLSGGAAALTVSVAFHHYKTAYTTSGSGVGDTAAIGVTPACEIGQRKLLQLATKTAAGDHITFDAASFTYGAAAVTAMALTNVGDYALVEWTGAKWAVLYYSAGVVTHA